MGGFKLYRDRVPGACDGCAFVRVVRTQSQQLEVTCGRTEKRVMEPLEYCTGRMAREASVNDLPDWMRSTAWIPVLVRGKKSFMPMEKLFGGDGFSAPRVAGFVVQDGKKRRRKKK